eukprot:TRINITY_DN3369_c1_g1_i4.p1 TRINITY_DN3369_c1_g1~~TRINITY_DN3369_c1_g1_i4.p1  ORF type:complete len:359 (+),score=63.28 TRINITY_DN3369_c1_g1_i4:275-1351(+)
MELEVLTASHNTTATTMDLTNTAAALFTACAASESLITVMASQQEEEEEAQVIVPSIAAPVVSIPSEATNLSNAPILVSPTLAAAASPRDVIQRSASGSNNSSPNLSTLVPRLPARPTKRFDKLLILDLDGTLVHSEFAPRPSRDHHFSLFNDEIYVYKRPGLDHFLRMCVQWFDVAVWTASGCEYAASIVRNIFPAQGAELSFLFSSSRCTSKICPLTGERIIIKDLKKVKRKGYDLSKMLIVDDTPSTFKRNYGNAVYIQPYWGTKIDDALPLLLRYLEKIGSVDNVRKIEKRSWVREAVNMLALELQLTTTPPLYTSTSQPTTATSTTRTTSTAPEYEPEDMDMPATVTPVGLCV